MAYQAINRSNSSKLANSSCLQGRVKGSFEDLVKAFGDPVLCEGFKTDAEWIIEFRNVENFNEVVIATIYNYKNGKSYLGESGKDVVDITDWNVGGFQPKAAELVNRFIEGL